MSAPHEPAPTAPVPIVTATGGGGIWSAQFVWVTIGAVAMIFLAAMQSLAITTVMPVVVDDLGGTALYAVAF